MAAINITGENFNKTVRGEGITLVDFWASWCGPCMRFKPVFEKAAEANPDITFAKVDTEAEQGLASALGISSIPTLMVFRDDVLVYREAGALPASALNSLIEQVRGEGITLVDFWASWCGPCMRFKPVFEKAAEANPDITFAKVDTEAEQGLASALGISSIPTLMVFRDDVLVYREAGALPASALNSLIEQVRGLDMAEVKAKIAAEEAEGAK